MSMIHDDHHHHHHHHTSRTVNIGDVKLYIISSPELILINN